jgi:hypothetical protein
MQQHFDVSTCSITVICVPSVKVTCEEVSDSYSKTTHNGPPRRTVVSGLTVQITDFFTKAVAQSGCTCLVLTPLQSCAQAIAYNVESTLPSVPFFTLLELAHVCGATDAENHEWWSLALLCQQQANQSVYQSTEILELI